MFFRLIVSISLILSNHISFSQEFEVPKNYRLKTKEDYPRYNKDIVKCVNWLENTPITQQSEKREEALKFLEKWILGSPVNFPYDTDMIPKSFNNSELMEDFMGGWVKYLIEHNNIVDTVKGTVSGFHTAFKIYKANKVLFKTDKLLIYLLKLDEKSELEKWLTDGILKH